MNSAKEAWLSLYTNELERIWQSDQGALRKPAMLHYVLRRELQDLQENLDDDIKLFKRQILSQEERKSSKRRASDGMGLAENELGGSSTKRRNFTSTRHIPKLQLSEKENIDVNTVESATEVSKMFTSTGVSDADMRSKLQSLIENIPDQSSMTKKGRIFDFKPSDINKTTSFNSHSESEDVVIDLTFCDDEMETSTTLKDIKSTLEDSDKSESSLVVYVTEPVSSTADCTELPGWSCEDCKKLYENSNLTPVELHEKMNACSKHGNKLETLDEIDGVLDTATFLTKDEHN